MNKQTVTFLIAGALALPGLCAAAGTESEPKPLDTLVVTATRTETELREIGSAITVITADEIERRQAVSVIDVLRGVPGLDVVQAGGIGRQSSVFLRGANSGQTLVLIDGMEMNDPSSPSTAFDFADLMADSIERIEILRGPQSTLYGSDAIGGVIHIITKKGAGKPHGFIQPEGGSYDTFKVGGGVSGGTNSVNYSVSASRLETNGFSAADTRLSGNDERDGYKNTNVAARFGVRPLDVLDFDWTLRFNDGETEVDDCGEAGCDDPNHDNATQRLFTRGQGRLLLFDGLWEQSFGVAYSLTDRSDTDRPDSISPFGGFPTFTGLSPAETRFRGDKIKLNWQNTLHVHETNTLILGVENEEDSIETSDDDPTTIDIDRRSANTWGFYAQDQIRLFDRWFTTAGVRVDDHNRIGSRVTWRVAQSINFDETGTRLKGSYGTGFKAPSLYQLFAPPIFGFPIGNADLAPEKSRGWDAGVEQSLWGDRVLVGASYFDNTFIDLIDFTFLSGFDNINRATAEGVESFVEIKPLDGLTLRGDYTYTRSNDEATRDRLVRRPTHKGSFDATYRFWDRADATVNVLLVGDRDDITFDPVTFVSRRETLPGYVLVNLAAGFQVNKYLKVFGRVDNLFDKKYQEIFGFGTSRIAGYAGIKVSFE